MAFICIIGCAYASTSCASQRSGVQGGTYENAPGDKDEYSIPQLAIIAGTVPVVGLVFAVFVWPKIKTCLEAAKLAKAEQVAKATE